MSGITRPLPHLTGNKKGNTCKARKLFHKEVFEDFIKYECQIDT